jgi:hypothetical protein
VKAGIATQMSPSFGMVSKYFAAAIFSFLILNFLLLMNYDKVLGHHFQPVILGLVHVAALGWISMVIFGALFQLIPVVLEVKLYSELFAKIQFWLFAVGTVGLVHSFWNINFGIHLTVYSSILMLAVLFFVLNIFLTLLKVKTWNLTSSYITAAVVYLFLTALLGLLLSINLGYPFIPMNHLLLLKAHAHTGFIGWVSMIIIGVALKLLPMFSLSHKYSLLPVRITFPLLNIGLIGLTIQFAFEISSLLFYLSAASVIISFLLFLLQVYFILKNRIRKAMDTGMKFSVISFAGLFVTLLVGLSLIFIDDLIIKTSLISVYGFMILFGFISLLIKAQLYKIFPFLVWFNKYSSLVGIKPVPMLKDMVNEKRADAGFLIMILGIFIAAAGLLLSEPLFLLAAFSLTFLSSLIFTYNMIKIYKG